MAVALWVDTASMGVGREPRAKPSQGFPLRRREESPPIRSLVVVEDDEDLQFLIEAAFSLDSRFAVACVSATADDALEMIQANEPEVIVLEHDLAGRVSGFEAARRFRDVAPHSKIILFTAHAELREAAAAEPAVDAFVLRSDSALLLSVAQQLLAMPGSAT